jgi:fructokinase
MPEVLCMGELLVEFVSNQENVPLADAPGFVKAPGGAPANVAVALQRLGVSAGFAGKVGDDPFGVYLRQSLEAYGVDTRFLLVDPRARTTSVFVAVWDDGRKDLCFYRNPGADMLLAPTEIGSELLEGVRCFHFGSIGFIGGPLASAQRKALEMARASGLMISYDPNYRPTLWPTVDQAQAVIGDGFRHCHLAKVSEEEWQVATGETDLHRGAEVVLALGVQLLVISRGDRGAIATNGDFWIEQPAFRTEVVETTGAGDGFVAAMITRLLPEWKRLGSLATVRSEVVGSALRYAAAVGALTCTRKGAIPALPTMQEALDFLAHQE